MALKRLRYFWRSIRLLFLSLRIIQYNLMPFFSYIGSCRYENETFTETAEYADVVIRFSEDEAGEIPYSVYNLTVNFQVIGYYYGFFNNNYSFVASGTDITLATQMEHDYADGETQRWKDYHLL